MRAALLSRPLRCFIHHIAEELFRALCSFGRNAFTPSPGGFPEIEFPWMNRAEVNAEATVVRSSTTTLAGGSLPSTVNRTMAGLLPLRAVPFGQRASAIFDRTRPKIAGKNQRLSPCANCPFARIHFSCHRDRANGGACGIAGGPAGCGCWNCLRSICRRGGSWHHAKQPRVRDLHVP